MNNFEITEMSFDIACTQIENYLSFGTCADELGISEKDFYKLAEQNKTTALLIHKLFLETYGDEKKVDGWISIDDKLPEIGQSVFVYLSDKGFQEVPYLVTKFDKYGFNISNVTHWKHLSPPNIKG